MIYLLTCTKCNIQYVGLTEQCLHERMNGHRASVKAGKSTFLYEHFNLEGHSFADATVQIIDIVDDNLPDIKQTLSKLELFWINALSTAYPLGLNDNIKGCGNISKSSLSDIYFITTIKRYKRGHGCKKKLKIVKEKREKRYFKKNEVERKIIELKDDLELNKKEFYRKLKKLQNSEIKQLGQFCHGSIGIVYNVIKSFCKTSFNANNSKPKSISEFIVFPFSSKVVDLLNINSIIKDTKIASHLPDSIKPFCPLKVYFSYDLPMGRKLFNYNRFLKELDKDLMANILESDCSCERSSYIYEPHGHIITGDLSFITNNTLRDVMQFGTKFREPVYQSQDELYNILITAIDDFITKIIKKYKVNADEMHEWKNNVKRVLKNKIDFFVKNKPVLFEKIPLILDNKEVKDYLLYLQKHFIICSIDKAANNYVFIYKKFYLVTLMTELGVDLNTLECTGNNTYGPVTVTEEELIKNHCKFLKDNFNITVTKKNLCIPRIFWNPKLHKNPYKARYIAGASNCTTKQLSILVNKALKVLKEYFTRYCQSVYRNTGINCDWSINSSSQFLVKLQNTDLYNMQVYDFTTLYTNLDLTVVETLLFEMIELLFNNTNKYICISKFNDNCFFSKKEYNGYHCFTAEQLQKAIHFLLNNTYVYFGGFILRQNRGIPMGGNSSSQFADLSLSKSEFNYMISLTKDKKFSLAKLLSNNTRYVDDLATLNYLHFHNLISQIYPSDLKMERSGNNNKDVNYLDVNIQIGDNRVTTEVYNKLDDFNFPVVSFTFPHGNIPVKIGYNVFYSQVLRYSNIYSDLYPFVSAINRLYNLLISRSYKHIMLQREFNDLMRSKPEILLKYRIKDISDIRNDIFKIV